MPDIPSFLLRQVGLLGCVVGPVAIAFQVSSMPEFSIYCSSNMDGTGKCRRVDRDESLSCVIIPGAVIACRDKARRKYECVQYGAILANQTQFSCLPDRDNSVNDQIFDSAGDGNDTGVPSVDSPILPSAAPAVKPGTSMSGPAAPKPPVRNLNGAIQNPFVDNSESIKMTKPAYQFHDAY